MIIIRITINDGRKFFINENAKGIILVNDIGKAFKYQTTLEFKVTWKLNDIMKPPSHSNKDLLFKKENVVKFEFIDEYTSDIKQFDVNENEIEIGQEIYVSSTSFNMLMKCGIKSSHWLYGEDDELISFPEDSDYDRVVKIYYYCRGLMHTIKNHNNWNDRYDKHSWNSSFNLHHKLMLNPIIQQICLLNFDSCHKFIIYKKLI